MLTFHAAFARKDSKGYPSAGFQMENALTRGNFKGYDNLGAYSNFEEKKRKSRSG
jgi:hypothetical protein